MSTYSHDDWDRLVEYMLGECTGHDRDEIRARIAVDEEKARLLKEIRVVWEGLERPERDVDVDAAWHRFRSRLRQRARIHVLPDARADAQAARPDASPSIGAKGPEPGVRRRSNGSTRPPARLRAPVSSRHARRWQARRRHRGAALHGLRVALPLLLVGLGLVMAVRFWKLPVPLPHEAEPALEVFSTRANERSVVRLADGTEVRLNVNSTLTVPARFAADTREVTLEGEAFFDVASDSLHPFIVRAGEARMEVLGTRFNVSAWPEEHAVEVVVEEGRVVLGRNEAADTVVLRPRHLGRIQEGQSEVFHRTGVRLGHYLVWMGGPLTFDGASIEEILDVLERRYNIDAEFTGVRAGVRPLHVAFDEEPLNDVLKVIAATLNLAYTSEVGKVTFYPAPDYPASDEAP